MIYTFARIDWLLTDQQATAALAAIALLLAVAALLKKPEAVAGALARQAHAYGQRERIFHWL